jgi:prolyl-tRNA editing enzyme YbaK/EbsC (Cys-tRNA(Pro) deacylase)
MDVWTPDNLQQHLDTHAIPAEIIRLAQHTPTVPAAANALGVGVELIVKTVVFLINECPYAVLANGVQRVDRRKLARHFVVNRKKVKLAEGNEVIALTGYAPGTVPPLGHRQPLMMIMEPRILNLEVVYAGGGGIDALLKICSVDLHRLTAATVLDVMEEMTNQGAEALE